MKFQILNIVGLLGLMTTISLAQTTPELISAVNSNAHFGRRFLQATGNSSANLVVSPLSAQLALALTSLGARGRTAEQINAAMNILQNGPQPNYGELMRLLQDQNDTMVRIVNRVYVSSELCTLRPEFLQSARDNLRSDALGVTFGNPETEDAINKWVEEATENRIKNLVPRGLLDEDTITVLVNALYFKGNWGRRFQREQTRPFHISGDRTVNTPFLIQTKTEERDDVKYSDIRDISARLLDLPYKGKNFRFLIVLPNEGSSIEQLEAALSTRDLRALQKSAEISEGQEIYIPKMDLDVSVDLIPPLRQLGITDLFVKNAADLRNTCVDGQHIYISDAIQKTFFKLTVEGTEGASATLIKGTLESGVIDPPPPFDANRPFLFFLVHSSTDDQSTVLFSGRYVSP